MSLPYLDAAALDSALPMPAAIDALERALRGGLDPAADPHRTALETGAGQLLVMPSAAGKDIAVKLVTVAPDNPARGRPRIQGIVVLFDPGTLAPVALLDGIALTAVRTPAVSALAARHLAPAGARRLVVFGSGPQAEGHVAAMRAVRPIEEVVVIGRDATRAAAFAARWAARGLAARSLAADVGAAADVAAGVDVAADVARADIVVCATTAREPLFDGGLVPDGACVVAVGSHEPTAREVDATLVHRSLIVVEDVAAALREAGDLLLAGVRPDQLHTLSDVVCRGAPPGPRPSLVKTVGMAWEDAVVAAAAVDRWRR